MSETTTVGSAQASEADLYPCCDPRACDGCACCADGKGETTSCC